MKKRNRPTNYMDGCDYPIEVFVRSNASLISPGRRMALLLGRSRIQKLALIPHLYRGGHTSQLDLTGKECYSSLLLFDLLLFCSQSSVQIFGGFLFLGFHCFL